jgi:Fucose dissimilation pathway protein FucU
MLKGLDPLLPPDLLHALAAMGHGDELALVDRNYPATSTSQRLIRLDGADTAAAARAILGLFPLDTFVDEPLLRMEVVGSPDEVTPVQRELAGIASELEDREVAMGSLERFAFYERSRGAFATVITGEDAPYACFLLIKGVIA